MLYFYSVFLIFRELHIDPNLVFGVVSRREMEEVIYSDINIKMWGQTSHFYSVTKVIKYLQIYLLTWQPKRKQSKQVFIELSNGIFTWQCLGNTHWRADTDIIFQETKHLACFQLHPHWANSWSRCRGGTGLAKKLIKVFP